MKHFIVANYNQKVPHGSDVSHFQGAILEASENEMRKAFILGSQMRQHSRRRL